MDTLNKSVDKGSKIDGNNQNCKSTQKRQNIKFSSSRTNLTAPTEQEGAQIIETCKRIASIKSSYSYLLLELTPMDSTR